MQEMRRTPAQAAGGAKPVSVQARKCATSCYMDLLLPACQQEIFLSSQKTQQARGEPTSSLLQA